MKTSVWLMAGALLGTACGVASAQQNTIRFGFASVQPNSSASDVTGPFTPAGLSLKVQDATTPMFSYVREINDQWDIEFALGVPPKHDIAIVVRNAALPAGVQALNGQAGAQVTQVAPTLFATYKFLDKNSTLRPFVGVGINYTRFRPADSTAAGNTLNGGPTSLNLEDSIGLAMHAGATYRLGGPWSVTAAVTTAQVKTKLTTNTLGIVRTADITFHPVVFTMALGYSF